MQGARISRICTSVFSRAAPQQCRQYPRRFFAANAAGFFRASNPQLAVISFKLADIGEGIAEVELLKWYIKEGATIDEMDNICEVQSDKSAVEISSPHSGKIIKFHHTVGDMVKIGAPLMDIDVEGDAGDDTAAKEKQETKNLPPAAEEIKETPKAKTSQTVLASPACRAYARQNRIDLSDVTATGPGGRVLKEDVIRFQEGATKPSSMKTPPAAAKIQEQQPAKAMPAPPKTRPPVAAGDVKEEVMLTSGVAKGMVKSMNASLRVPHVSLQEEIDMTDLINMRASMNTFLGAQKPPAKITVTPLIIKALSEALKRVPILNSKFNADSQDRYTLYHNHNVSVAIDTPSGLLVPNIKNVESMGLMEIQEHLTHLQHLAMNNKLTTSHLTGGTIALSNVGVIGCTAVRPILFDGQAAILGLGRLQKLPKYNAATKGFDARDMMNITASVDHRHVDGATIARFMSQLRALIENPSLMLL